MRASWKKILMMVGAALVLLKFSTKIKSEASKVPLLGPFIQD
jgi:hypothetical protein